MGCPEGRGFGMYHHEKGQYGAGMQVPFVPAPLLCVAALVGFCFGLLMGKMGARKRMMMMGMGGPQMGGMYGGKMGMMGGPGMRGMGMMGPGMHGSGSGMCWPGKMGKMGKGYGYGGMHHHHHGYGQGECYESHEHGEEGPEESEGKTKK